jgi:hypothetical protein
MEFMFFIGDKDRNQTWIRYPKTFQSREEAEAFKDRFLEVAPAWRHVRIREIFHFGANVKEHAPPLAGAHTETGGEG